MPVDRFVYQGSPQRVVFGAGTLDELAGEVERLGLERVLVLSTSARQTVTARVADLFGRRCASVFAKARVHTPVEVTSEAIDLVTAGRVDCTVAVGGGTAIGLGKAIALRTHFPQVAVPTTYAGSEATSILGETISGVKQMTRDARILPEVVLYDVDLTLTLPVGLSVASAMNGVAHAVEGLYAEHRSPPLSLMAEDGIRAFASAVPGLARDAADQDVRVQALFGAWLCGTVLDGTAMALHHKLCHVLGGAFDLPHAETHAIVLPHVAAYNREAATDALQQVARALGTTDAAQGLFELARHGDVPTRLRDLGMPEAGLDRAADLATAEPYWNPRPFAREAVRALLDDAWRGVRPYA